MTDVTPQVRNGVMQNKAGEMGNSGRKRRQDTGSPPRPSGVTDVLLNSNVWSLELSDTQFLFPSTNNELFHYSIHGKATKQTHISQEEEASFRLKLIYP